MYDIDMDQILETCKLVYDRSPRAFGIAHVSLDENGAPADATIVYLNPPMAATAKVDPEDLRGKNIYEIWPYGDKQWLDYFYKAAYEDEAAEFETANVAYGSFQNVAAFPIKRGYCGYEVQDITRWMESSHLTMENVNAGLFFYDPSTETLLLTDPVRECMALDTEYISVGDFTERLFEGDVADRIYQAITYQSKEYDHVLYEEPLRDGRWVRMSLSHVSNTRRFAIGFLEDITVLHEAEESSARRFEIIESLSAEYFALYIVKLNEDSIEPYLLRDEAALFFNKDIGECADYSKWLENYIEKYVNEEDRDKVSSQLRLSSLLEFVAQGSKGFSVACRRHYRGTDQYIELRVIALTENFGEVVLAARNINDEVQQQITQKDALQSALILAQHASDAKTVFLTNMSHDFRTPLNSIMGFTELALEHIDDKERLRDSLGKIMLSSEHLLNLINDILDVSRIESGKVVLKEDPISLSDLLEGLRDIFSVQAEERGIDFNLDYQDIRHSHVLVDQLKLNQILVNIVGNSMKYTNRGGRVDVFASEGDASPSGIPMFTFTIQDDGCGMSKDFLDRIFMPFERDSDNKDLENVAEGTGLGMTITKNLVDLIGGTIKVSSELNHGSRFDITLPIKLDLEYEDISKKEASLPIDIPDNFDGRRILIVDDDDLSREMLKCILTMHGFEVEEASDGQDGVDAVSRSDIGYFDAVIMDMRMPKLSGDEATSVIRSLPRSDVSDIPIIAVTADAFAEGYRRARAAGMTAHITKPISSRKVLEVLAKCLSD